MKYKLTLTLISLAFLAILTACANKAIPIETPSAPQPTEVILQEQPTQDPTSVKVLNVCLGQEPDTLYPLSKHNHASSVVIGAIFNGPIQRLSTGEQAVILSSVPSFDNQGMMIVPVDVRKGAQVIDAFGKPSFLEPGTTVLPSGCRDINCAVVYTADSHIKMDQMLITFDVLPGVEWSDGTALSSDDFIFGYDLASDSDDSTIAYINERTQAYEKTSAMQFQWWGKPGYLTAAPASVLVPPMPFKLLGSIETQTIRDQYGYEITPIGWGPYLLDTWEDGQYIKLIKNNNYFRASDGLPKFDTVIFQFFDNPQQAIAAFLNGNCELVDSGVHAEAELPLLSELQTSGSLKLQISASPILESLQLRIGKQAITPTGGTLQEYDPLANRDLRIAINYCIDRQQIIDFSYAGNASAAVSYLPPFSANFTSDGSQFTNDPRRAAEILQGMGWKDTDKDPATMRKSQDVPGIPNDRELVLRYVTTDTPARRKVGQVLGEQLAKCGIGLQPEYVSPGIFYGSGAEGTLSGRNFDIVQIASGTFGHQDSCVQYITSQIPTSTNGWKGTNFGGFSNPDFDTACSQVVNDDGVSDVYRSSSINAQKIYNNEVPGIPLYWRPKVLVTAPNLCIPQMDPAAENDLWNLESYRFGNDCTQTE